MDGDLERNLATCSKPELWQTWFAEAEAAMQAQWRDPIWPLIRGADFRSVLELGPGAGRNSERLARLAGALHLVDLNAYALERCRERFRAHAGPCVLHFHRNDGRSLPFLADASISFVYSWDSMVHFERGVVEGYVAEFARVMRPGATGFVHHSNWGAVSDDPDIEHAPHLRSNLTAELFGRYCAANGLLRTHFLVFDWGGAPQSDCISVFCKPDPRRPLASARVRLRQHFDWLRWRTTRGRA